MKKVPFTKTKQYKKGLIGEKIVKDYLTDKGWVVYAPHKSKNSSWEFFDIMAIQQDNRVDKPKMFIGDAKTKSRLNHYNAQGIDLHHFKKYIKLSEQMKVPFKLFFTDEYARTLSVIELTREMVLPENKVKSADGREYPLVKSFNNDKDTMILFAMEQIKILTLIDGKLSEKLKSLNERGEYNITDFSNINKK